MPDSINGKVVGSYGNYFPSDIKAGKQAGESKGFGTLKDALEFAAKNPGAEVVTKGPDNKFYLNEIKGVTYSVDEAETNIRKNDTITVDGKNFRVVAFVDNNNNVITQADKDSNLESVGNVLNLASNLSKTHLFTKEIAFPTKAEKQLVSVGAPNWKDSEWPKGSDVTEAQEKEAITKYASMVIQQFRSENGRNPDMKELLTEIIKNSDKLPYSSTNDISGKLKIFGSPLKIFGSENSSSVVFQSGTGRCGDLADLHYKFAIEGASQLGFEKEMKEHVFVIGVEGKSGANVNHAALGFIDSPKTIKDIDKDNLKNTTIFDPWMRSAKSQDANTWGQEYCFDITKHPLLPLRNIMGPYVHKFETTVTDDRYTISAFTPDYSLNREFEYKLNE